MDHRDYRASGSTQPKVIAYITTITTNRGSCLRCSLRATSLPYHIDYTTTTTLITATTTTRTTSTTDSTPNHFNRAETHAPKHPLFATPLSPVHNRHSVFFRSLEKSFQCFKTQDIKLPDRTLMQPRTVWRNLLMGIDWILGLRVTGSWIGAKGFIWVRFWV